MAGHNAQTSFCRKLEDLWSGNESKEGDDDQSFRQCQAYLQLYSHCLCHQNREIRVCPCLSLFAVWLLKLFAYVSLCMLSVHTLYNLKYKVFIFNWPPSARWFLCWFSNNICILVKTGFTCCINVKAINIWTFFNLHSYKFLYSFVKVQNTLPHAYHIFIGLIILLPPASPMLQINPP